jgi:hypothetical protein
MAIKVSGVSSEEALVTAADHALAPPAISGRCGRGFK